MQSGDRGGVVNVGPDGSVWVVVFGNDFANRKVSTLDGVPLSVTWIAPGWNVARLVSTVIDNLTWDDPEFPLTVSD
jgi:hypothetical protein